MVLATHFPISHVEQGFRLPAMLKYDSC